MPKVMLSSIYRPLLQQVNTTYCDSTENSKDSVKGCCDTHHTLANHDREWLLCILPSTLIFREASMCIIELYWPRKFTRQFGYTQSRVGAPRLYHMQEASIIDDYRSWVNFSGRDTLEHFLYPLASGIMASASCTIGNGMPKLCGIFFC